MVWMVLFVPYLYLAAVVMPGVQHDVQAVALDAGCATPLDLFIVGIDRADALKALECMGQEGRDIYRAAEVREDAVYPISYGLLLAFTLWALSGFAGIRTKKGLLALLPFLAVAFDYVENAHIVQLIDQFPNLSEETVEMASLGNQFKWSFAFVSMALILILLALGGIRMWREDRGSQD